MNKNPVTKRNHPMNQLFQSFWDNEFGGLLSNSFAECDHRPNVSLAEDDHHVYIEAALPGLDSKEIEVTLERGVLWIRGEKAEDKSNPEKKYHYKAKRSYSFKLVVPDSVNESVSPNAEYKQGILHITFDKIKKENPKKIEIRCN